MSADQSPASSIDPQLERAEADAVLASDLFRRARSLRQILAYVCEQYFSGGTPNIKEYNIAVEALGRSADFDPNADTIVRVEASRLRKRLREYYATEGAEHPVQLFLPSTGYVPQFVPRPQPGATGLEAAAGPAEEPAATVPQEPRRAIRKLILILACGVIVISAAAFLLWRFREPARAPAVQAQPTVPGPSGAPAAAPAEAVRILCGYTRPEFTDSLGRLWSGDRYFQGGSAQEWPDDVAGVTDPTLYHTGRLGREFRYDIPLKPGVYELRLLLMESYFGKLQAYNSGEGSRVFSVSVNGVMRLPSIDVYADAGGADIPADRVLTDVSPAADGLVHLVFSGLSDWATVSGIELVRSTPGRMLPVRIVAGGRSYYDRAGRFWGADRYFMGGRTVRRPVSLQGTDDPELYSNSRWGRFTYSIPVAPGHKYQVTLKFVETFFGPTTSAKDGGVGSRVFDVYCNGLALLRNFDIYKEAGGENRALDRVFRGVVPNGQGRLLLTFAPVVDYATVYGIEVIDEVR